MLARDIVRLLLSTAWPTRPSGDLVAEVLVFFAIGLFAFSAFQLLLRSVLRDAGHADAGARERRGGGVNVLVNLLFFFVLDLGVPGLALGHAVSYVFASIALLLVVRARIGGLDGRRSCACSGACSSPASPRGGGVARRARHRRVARDDDDRRAGDPGAHRGDGRARGLPRVGCGPADRGGHDGAPPGDGEVAG